MAAPMTSGPESPSALSASPAGVTSPTGPVTLAGHRVAYLLGIGGVGLCAGAELLLARGLAVAGSEQKPSERVDRLRAQGVAVDLEADAPRLPADADLVVASAAIPRSHPLLVEAGRRGLVVWKYADLLGALMADRHGVCVAGTHGKTTTTALVASALVHAGRDPSFVVGGDLRAFGSGARAGRGPQFVAEACEFDRTFLHLRPQVAVVTNVEEDHLDYYRDLAEIEDAFRAFAALVPSGGRLVVDEAYAALFRGDARVRAPLWTYGFGASADWRASDVEPGASPRHTAFRLRGPEGTTGRIEVPLAGRHNVENALGAVAALAACGLAAEEIRDGLAAFGGVGRRLEVVVERGGVLVLDDYGHHPVEIRATLDTLRSRYPDRRVLLVFQPHQASRTRVMLEAFATALAGADEAWLPPIFLARDSEEARRGITSEDLATAVRRRGGRAMTLPDLPAAVEHARRYVRPGDVLVTMGAGDVDEVARGLADRLW